MSFLAAFDFFASKVFKTGRVQAHLSSPFQQHKPGTANYTVNLLSAITARDHSHGGTQAVIVLFGNLFQRSFYLCCRLRGATTLTPHYASVYTSKEVYYRPAGLR